MKAAEYFVGLMSGTSVDGVDAALVQMQAGAASPRLVTALASPMPAGLREEILTLCQSGSDEIERLGSLDTRLGRLFAEAALAVIAHAGMSPSDIRAIGSHGQTIRHRPQREASFTLQIGDPNTIAERTGITTIADFRRRDMAAGGQGAPLVPAFHEAVFRGTTRSRIVLNIGGMANITVLPGDTALPVGGFDTGPGNVLLDAWHQRHRGGTFDRDGVWAASGSVDGRLLQCLIQEPWLSVVPPRSTGRELFSLSWLEARAGHLLGAIAPENVQATLAEFTARCISDAVARWGAPEGELFVCGGGTHNGDLQRRLSRLMPSFRLASTSELGIDPDWVEAMAFAWLAARTIAGLPGNVPAVTGAGSAVVLGGIYPGKNGV